MIRVTFELLPHGDASTARVIGLMEIAHLREHLDGWADYACVLKKTPPFAGALDFAWKKGRLRSEAGLVSGVLTGEDEEIVAGLATGHHRTRRGVYDLAFRALRACSLGARNPE